jgi:hypothetical protein
MSLSVYEVTVPVYLRLLSGLSRTLAKAEEFATAKKIDPAVLITARLYPDMWSFGQQVNTVCNHAVRGTARLAGMAVPSFDGKDASFAELAARVAWTVAHLNSVDRAALNQGADRVIVFPTGDEEHRMSGRDYLLTFSLPNFYFHLTTAYDILRHNGVPVAKADFLAE